MDEPRLPMSVHAATHLQREHQPPQQNTERNSYRSSKLHRGGRHGGQQQRAASSDARQRGVLQRPKAHLMARTIADLLEEPKIALMHRVVKIAGPDVAWQSLVETMNVEKEGGLAVNINACGRAKHMLELDENTKQLQPRRRTKGGIFLSVVKSHVTKEVYKEIFEIEDQVKKKRKQQIRQIRAKKMESKISELPIQELYISRSLGSSRPTDTADVEAEEGEVDDTMGEE